jgi:hypothetical protein
MAIRRLGISNPTLNTDTEIFSAVSATYLCSVIVTNKDSVEKTARVWVKPSGSTLASQYGYIIYDVAVPAANSIETHRFAISDGDSVWVRGNSSSLSFSLNGIYDSSASIDDHILETTNVHGIADTSQLATTTTTNSLNTRLISIELGLGIFD